MIADRHSYAAVTLAYWAFTLTDGALRMLVLLHFHSLGYTPLDIAILFLLYEAMGIVTNLLGGWIGARFGLRVTLFAGLAIQIGALMMLSATDPAWALGISVAYVMAAQALSGIAKDLTKMSSKSAVKLVIRENEGQGLLFKWIAILTGSKNALKGVGFLCGGVLLQVLGFEGSLWSMAGLLTVVLVASTRLIGADLGKAAAKIASRDLFSKSRAINVLSFARVFLFASRDVWFVVGVPVFLAEILGWSFSGIGGFMAAWVIGYGIVQASAPKMLASTRDAASASRAAWVWGFVLAALTAALAFAMSWSGEHSAMILVGGLFVFGVVFAINSAVHSYLIVAFSDDDKVTLNVGFYYMANAIGRFAGTLLSGIVYQFAGLAACLWTSAVMVLIAAVSAMAMGPGRAATVPRTE
ncbi:MAG: organoarsenical effux MFS transporter ArsJ [Rhodospirillales bacterium]